MAEASEENLGTEALAERDIRAGTTSEDTRDVYTCYSTQEMERAVEVLVEHGIDVLVRDQTSSAFPTRVGLQGRMVLAVPETVWADARAHLTAAIEDTVLGDEGDLSAPA
ncbi:MAG TPA: hypothetical protein VFH51_18595 [Myxococcota bacterium]|nr:hypothetical protein [Myxococcota bacterium]